MRKASVIETTPLKLSPINLVHATRKWVTANVPEEGHQDFRRLPDDWKLVFMKVLHSDELTVDELHEALALTGYYGSAKSLATKISMAGAYTEGGPLPSRNAKSSHGIHPTNPVEDYLNGVDAELAKLKRN